ncbi:filamentous hemagglutinin N-terminal domain-containing protein [Desmonostoc muscorum CCALA 125]|nr:filamentous hemagglutinin N-terminal domain-containing protein [Desmonostoc muscorum CCALA 125]
MKSCQNPLLFCRDSAVHVSILARVFSFLGGLAIPTVSYVNAFPHTSALAQITPDSTLGTESSVITPNVNIKGAGADQIDGGAITGSNLFHSFSEFNVKDGQRVYFSNPAGINNILGRVTGNNPSNILGTLGVNGNANLFLINPNGIIFGQNARLDLGGSFVASTANAIKFGEQGFFSATNPETSLLLTVNPSAFFFNQIQPGTIENRSTAPTGFNVFGLRVPDSRSLILLGGDVILNGGTLNAMGGRVELAGVRGGEVVGLNFDGDKLNLSFPENAKKTDVSIIDGFIDVRTADKGGSIFINAKNFSMSGNSLLVAGISEGLGTVNSQAGDINITSETVSLSGLSTIFNTVESNAIGNGGNITIQAGSFSLSEGAELIAETYAQGNAGKIALQVRDRIAFDGMDSEGNPSGIFNNVRPGAKGNAGDIYLTAGSFSLTNGARLQTNTRSQGNAGNVIVQVRDRIYFDVVNTSDINNFTGIFTAVGTDGEGRGGDIDIQAGSLDLRNGAQLTANTFEKGDAGNIKIEVRDRVSFDGVSILGGSGASSSVGEVKEDTTIPAIGQGGNIEISAKSLSLTNGAGIAASTVSGSQGNAGNIKIVTNETVNLQNNAGITVDSQGSGKAGNIEIQTDYLTLDNQSNISAETASNTGGNISFKLQNLLLLRRESKISTNAGTAEAGGDGGNITINEPKGFIVAAPNENNDITANAFNGSGGKVNINPAGIFGLKPLSRQELERSLQTTDPTKLDPNQLPTSDITAISQTNPSLNGEVNLNTPNTDPSQGLQELPTDIVDVSGLINQNLCVAAQGSEFIVTGKGGLPPSPYEIISANTAWEDWLISSQSQTQPTPTTNNSSDKQQTESTTIIEAQGLVKDANGNAILTANPVTVTPKDTWLHPQDCHAILDFGF